MLPKSVDQSLLRRSMAVASISFEMAAPTVLGWYLDNRMGWTPWATMIGATLGFAAGIGHMLRLASAKEAKPNPPSPPEGGAP
jgi:F0F1-type ATP synthase assembly protein I